MDGQNRAAGSRAETGFYCSTSGTYFSDKESLAEHYKSDFHRYNLKRKVAGLPPVTKEWFEARKAQLTSASASSHQKIWFDPLTKKKFQTQQTYQAHVQSKKYQQLVRDSGEPAPAPIIMVKQQQQQEASSSSNTTATAGSTDAAAGAKGSKAGSAAAGFTVKAPARTSAAAPTAAAAADGQDESSEAEDDSSGWETVSEDDDEAAGQQQGEEEEEEWEEWDSCVSLFDNKRSASMQDNLQYMYKNFGFYLPDAEYLVDPEGLIKYLGAKLQYGKVPLYSGGDDPTAKQFRSLHAVQRHMVDTNQCKMVYDGNEDEYEDFYDYSADNEPAGEEQASASATAAAAGDAEAQGKQLALAMDGLSISNSSGAAVTSGWELTVSGSGQGSGASSKNLGSRELARYYKQRPKPQETRQSVIVNTIIAQYRSLGITTRSNKPAPVERAAQRQQQQNQTRQQQLLWMRNNVNFNLPKNVTY